MQNPFVWYDLMCADVARAEKFYGAVVGWTFTDQPPSYRVANVDGIGVGGIMETPEHIKAMPPFWGGYIYTPDVDGACARCITLGGKVLRAAWDIPGILRMAVLADPSGAMFNIMQPFMAAPERAVRPGTPGSIGWRELHGGEVDKDFAFYEALFGWSKGTVMPMGEMGDYLLFQVNGEDYGGMMRKFAGMPNAFWAYYFLVDGIDAAVARILKAGGSITFGPDKVPSARWSVNAQDDQGAHFSLLSDTK